MATQSAEWSSKWAASRYRNVTKAEARAAARARVTIDKRRGRQTEQWIKDLAASKDS